MKSLDQVDYGPLKDLDKAWSQTLRQVLFLPVANAFLAGAVLLSLVAVYFQQFYVIFYVGLLLCSWLGKKVSDYKARMWQQFAAANGWQVVDDDAPDFFIPPGLADVGHSRTLSPVVHAEFDGFECDLFLYQFTTGSGKSSVTHFYTIAEVELARPFPHLILDSKVTRTLQQRGDALQFIKLEGDFDKYFSLYCRANEQIDALSIITPDVMQTLIDANQPQDIEIMDQYLYFICAQDERSFQAMPLLLRSVDALASQIAHKSQTITYAAEGMPAAGTLSPSVTTYLESGRKAPRNIAIMTFWVLVLPALVIVIMGVIGTMVSP